MRKLPEHIPAAKQHWRMYYKSTAVKLHFCGGRERLHYVKIVKNAVNNSTFCKIKLVKHPKR